MNFLNINLRIITDLKYSKINKVNYTANRSRVSIPGRLVSHEQIDHHAKFGCCFSHWVRACWRSQNFDRGCWGPAPLDRARL